MAQAGTQLALTPFLYASLNESDQFGFSLAYQWTNDFSFTAAYGHASVQARYDNSVLGVAMARAGDAAVMNSMEDFAKWFTQWMAFTPTRPSVRVRILLIWHAHFLSLSCQQMLRRSLEQRSFRCRVFFHIEEPILQAAILSRCIIKLLPSTQYIPVIRGPPLDTALWDDPRAYETELHRLGSV